MPTTSKIFIDTNVFVSIRDENDSTHNKSLGLFTKLERNSSQLYTSSDVVGETLTVMSRKLGKTIAMDWYQDYKKSAVVEIFLDEEMHNEARKVFLQARLKNISFVDCSSIIAMKSSKITTAFTFDEHFKKLGVNLLK